MLSGTLAGAAGLFDLFAKEVGRSRQNDGHAATLDGLNGASDDGARRVVAAHGVDGDGDARHEELDNDNW